MEKELNIINFEYQETKKQTIFYKSLAIVLIFLFLFVPLYDLVDIFRRDYFGGMCCLLPCPNTFSGYFFI